MSSSARISVAVLVVGLVVAGAFSHDSLEASRTSFGSAPHGFAAVHALLTELGASPGRSTASARELAPGGTLWWIEPNGLCSGVEQGAIAEGRSGVWQALEWMRAGGTGVVWLGEPSAPCLEDGRLDGVPMPRRRSDLAEPDGPESEPSDDGAGSVVAGSVDPTRPPRDLGDLSLGTFLPGSGWRVFARTPAGSPWAVARTLGEGRLVLVADAAPLRNRWLDHGDAAPLALDLVRAFGEPWIDEREHGLLPRPNPIVYLLRSTALPVFLGAAALAVLVLWMGRAVPVGDLAPLQPPPPVLGAFVDSLATLYASTRDYVHVLDRYRGFSVSQLRRALHLRPDTPLREVRERVAARGRIDPTRLDALEPGRPCRDAKTLQDEVDRLDALVKEISG